MSEPIEEIVNIDRIVHEPARLAILTTLAECVHADFMYLQAVTGMSRGNLSLHLGKLEAAGLIEIEKTYRHKTPRTIVRLTKPGKLAIKAYWRQIETTRRTVSKWLMRRRMVAPEPEFG